MNNEEIIKEFRKIGGYRSPSSKVENFILKALSQQRVEIKRVVEKTIKYHVENSIPFNPLNLRDDIIKGIEKL